MRKLFAVPFVVCALAVAAPRALAQTVPVGHEAAALAALEQARVALESWRADVVAGAPVDAAAMTRLQQALQQVGEPVRALMARQAAAQPVAAARAAPAARGAEPSGAAAAAKAREIAGVWIDDVRALGDGAALRRQNALAALRAGLTGGDDVREHAALIALRSLGDVEFDKVGFRPFVLPFVRDASGQKLVQALYALHVTAPEPGDLALLLLAAAERRSPELDGSLSHLLVQYGGGQVAGRAEDLVLALLASDDARVRREALRGLWGARVGERLAARLIELSRDRESRHDAIYFGLSTLADKNAAVIDVLIETLADPDWNDAGRALWGLGHGVPEAHRPTVAAALAELYRARSDPKVREEARRIVRMYGGEEMAKALDE